MGGSLSQKRFLHGIMGIFKTAGTATVEVKPGEHFYFLENHCEASARRNDVMESLYALLWKRGVLVACRRENVTAAATPTNQKKVHICRCQVFGPNLRVKSSY
jgi:hypothetical protein